MALAARGLRDMDEGPERIEDAGELSRVRSQAKRIRRRALLIGAVATAATFLIGL